MRAAITTKFIGPTNSKGSRIKATCQAGSITVPYTYETSIDGQHHKAALALAEKLGWTGQWAGGSNPNGTGNVYVLVGEFFDGFSV